MVKDVMKKLNEKALVWLLLGIFIQFCSLAPASAFTIGDEREMGEKLLYSVRSAFPLVDDLDITQYITTLGQSVLEVAGIQYFDYHFYVVDSNQFNAFAAPSGLIFFYSGLIEKMNSEDELVSVLAHEIGHIVKRHLASRMEKGKYTSIASFGMALAALAFGGAAAPALFTGALATGQSLNLHFSRQDEEEADLMAYDWLKKLNRDPEGQVQMLETMRRIARYRSEQPPQYLVSHPNPEERLHYIESLLDNDRENLKETTNSPDDFEFIRFKYRILVKVKESREVKTYFASVIADNKSSEFQRVMAQYGLSQIAEKENDYSKSAILLKKVTEHFPNKNILMVDKGNLEFASGQFGEAEKTLKKALAVDGSNMYAAFILAKVLYRTGQSSESERYFKEVSYEFPEYAKVYFELGQIASDHELYGESSFYLGKYYLYEGKLKDAELNFKKALHAKTMSGKMTEECQGLLKKTKKLSE